MGDFTVDDKEFFRQAIFYTVQKIGIQTLADELKVSPGTIGRWIGGKSMPPKFSRNNIQERAVALLRKANEETEKEEFCDTVAKAVEKIGFVAIATQFEVAVSTVKRWINGTANPLPRMRREITRYLKEHLQSKKAD